MPAMSVATRRHKPRAANFSKASTFRAKAGSRSGCASSAATCRAATDSCKPQPATSAGTPNTVAPLPSHILDLSKVPAGFNDHPALAVLPFANVTGDSSHDYLAEGISEELIERLSRIRWLPVIARSSSFSLTQTADRNLVGRTLGAKYLLEGRLHKVRGRLLAGDCPHRGREPTYDLVASISAR